MKTDGQSLRHVLQASGDSGPALINGIFRCPLELRGGHVSKRTNSCSQRTPWCSDVKNHGIPGYKHRLSARALLSTYAHLTIFTGVTLEAPMDEPPRGR
jgi:hypothetical protein